MSAATSLLFLLLFFRLGVDLPRQLLLALLFLERLFSLSKLGGGMTYHLIDLVLERVV